MTFGLDYSDIVEIFKTHLKIENSVKSISHTFLNKRYADRIDYSPYFQRKYVWDSEKASYFIESILLGTEIPPIVLFDDSKKNEVIDGRQRYETIKSFLEDKLPLNINGLKSLTSLEGMRYSDLPEHIKLSFNNTKIRILQFSIVNEPSLTAEQEDKIKKEIFTRYNSGIIALKPQEIERAAYINDPLVRELKLKLENNNELLRKCQVLLMPKRKQTLKERDKINYILSRARHVLSMQYIPIQSYASASSKSDVIRNYLLLKVEVEPVDKTISGFELIVDKLYKLRNELLETNPMIADNNLFFEAMYWGLSVVREQSHDTFEQLCCQQIAKDVCSCSTQEIFWSGISVEKREFEMIFFVTGSHYYKSIINRYLFISNYFSSNHKINFDSHIKNKSEYTEIMSKNPSVNQFKDFKLSKTDPVSASVYDILNDVQSTQFILRPDYQRSELPNSIQKASYLLESILLGIKIPPIFIYKREDNVSEVIDGQQRLLSILGFLKEKYKDENGKEQTSDKHGFKLSKLRFLKELNGKDIDEIEKYNSSLKDRILDFQIDIVEINQELNPRFSPIDLFLRLNSKPFPIGENSFEMWNAFVSRPFLETIKSYANQYSGKLFKPVDTRMKNEELITMLAYLAYVERKDYIKPGDFLNIFVRNQRLNARINTKSNITNTLAEISRTNDPMFAKALKDVKSFIEKIQYLCGEDFEDFNQLISHSKKKTQSKTNQNFYLLWIALDHIDMKRLKKDKENIVKSIQELFLVSQEIKEDNFDVSNYINKLSKI